MNGSAGSRIIAWALMACGCVSPVGGDEPGWVNLIRGNTLDGWRQRGGKARYRLESGEIVGRSVPDTPNSTCAPSGSSETSSSSSNSRLIRA